MSGDLRWYLRRLRAMSIGEAAHRGYRAARDPIDRLRMRTGRYARPSAATQDHIDQWGGPAPFYFDRALAAAPVSDELAEQAAGICGGKRPDCYPFSR